MSRGITAVSREFIVLSASSNADCKLLICSVKIRDAFLLSSEIEPCIDVKLHKESKNQLIQTCINIIFVYLERHNYCFF